MRPILLFVVVVIITLLLRSTALTSLAAHGVVLDALVFATVLWSLRYGETWGSTFGFVAGLAADLDAAHWMGRHALVLALLGYVVGRLSHTLVRDSARNQAALLLVATIVHQTWVGAFESGGAAGLPYLIQRVALAALATVPAGTVLLLVVRHLAGQSFQSHAPVTSGSAD